MQAMLLIFLGVLGILVSAVPLIARLDEPTRAIFAMFALVVWVVWSFHATSVEIFSGGTVFTREYRSLLFIGAGAAIVQLLFLVKAAVATLGTSDASADARRMEANR